VRRTDDDLPPKFVLGGNLILLVLLAVFLAREITEPGPAVVIGIVGAVLVLLFGFLFVTVSSRLTGEIGSSSNPISGMTVATLLMTCLIFLALGWKSPMDAVLALSIGGVVCIAASNGGTTSQDLKTGYLVGGTPRWQQWAILIGALSSAALIGGTLLLFNNVGTVYSQRNLPPVNIDAEKIKLTETETYHGETFRVWRPTGEEKLKSTVEEGKTVKIKGGKYLVDDRGQVVYHVDPTITGDVDQRDEFVAFDQNVTLTAEEVKNIPHTVALRPKNAEGAQVAGPLTFYRLWKNNKEAHEKAEEELKEAGTDADRLKKLKKPEPYRSDLKDGYYVVDASGKVVYRVEGSKVSMKFPAPKTQVMGIIINGLLSDKLNWGMVLIGACIAIALELCGISSLAFAVGLYIPMQYSSPIFLGGMVRWGVDAYAARKVRAIAESAAPGDAAARAEAEVKAIAESESSPGMLLASGLIAGGSLAGVLIAFLNFLPDNIKESLDLEKPVAAVFAKITGGAVLQEGIALTIFLGLAAVVLMTGIGRLFRSPPGPPPPPDGGNGLGNGPPATAIK
jgi:hypothetical protein